MGGEGQNGQLVARGHGKTFGEAAANARLTATAPELLTALENLQASALIHLSTVDSLKLRNEIAAAREAIAKARGLKVAKEAA